MTTYTRPSSCSVALLLCAFATSSSPGQAQLPTTDVTADALVDQGVPGRRIRASSRPSLDSLLPLGREFFVDGTGSVGLGTLSPPEELSLRRNTSDLGISLDNTHTGGRRWVLFSHGEGSGNPAGSFVIQDQAADRARLTIRADGLVGIGSNNPEWGLTIERRHPDVGLELRNTYPGGRKWVLFSHGNHSGNPSGAFVIHDKTADRARFTIDASGHAVLDGPLTTSSLTITGGADLVERFETAELGVPPGSVMIIDPESPGRLCLSDRPYDTRVAGVVSGAGGVRAGLQLAQHGDLDGETPVAMLGRVFVRCSCENGLIRPGDRLTTSSRAGIAMRATDQSKTDGAVIGKAMTCLETGDGLVLTLVNVQ